MNLALKQKDDGTFTTASSFSSRILKVVQPVLTESTELPKDEIPLRGATKGVPQWLFFDEGTIIKSLKPVFVVFDKGRELCFAENETLRIYESGPTQAEANREFSKSIVHFYYYYKNLPDCKVTGKAKELKEIYSKYFQEVKG